MDKILITRIKKLKEMKNKVQLGFIFVIAGLAIVIYLEHRQLSYLQKGKNELEEKYGKELINKIELNNIITAKNLEAEQTFNQMKELQDKYESRKALKQKYLDNIELAILSSYGRVAQFKNKKYVKGIITTAFNVNEEPLVMQIKEVKIYGKTTRERALKLLGEDGNETDFKVFDEYYRELNKNSSYDYGIWQVNDCHWKKRSPSIFAIMVKYGVWKPDNDNWICNPRTNAIARMIIVGDRIRLGWDTYNMDETLYKILNSISGWEGIYEP